MISRWVGSSSTSRMRQAFVAVALGGKLPDLRHAAWIVPQAVVPLSA